MACGPSSEILFGCILLIFCQGCCSGTHLPPSGGCTIHDCKTEVSCMVINLEYVDCNWTRSQIQNKSYNFSSAFKSNDSYEECPQYLQKHGYLVGCRIPLKENNDIHRPFYTKLTVGRHHPVLKYYGNLKDRVKLRPPHNLSVDWNKNNGNLCLHWVDSTDLVKCGNFMVRYWRGLDEVPVENNVKEHQFCIHFIYKAVNVTFQVRSKLSSYCGNSDIWSDWTDPLLWGKHTDSISEPSPQSWWHLWVFFLGVIILIALTLLLCYCERIKVLLPMMPPDPSKNLQDLFYKHDGNVESWVHISRELREAFEPDYTESPCVVCEPSPTLKVKGCDEPVQQP